VEQVTGIPGPAGADGFFETAGMGVPSGREATIGQGQKDAGRASGDFGLDRQNRK
jgi:hypothetical protein